MTHVLVRVPGAKILHNSAMIMLIVHTRHGVFVKIMEVNGDSHVEMILMMTCLLACTFRVGVKHFDTRHSTVPTTAMTPACESNASLVALAWSQRSYSTITLVDAGNLHICITGLFLTDCKRF